MGEVTMKIGSGLGDLLLSMAQENILKGDTDKAIDLYVNGLNGFTKEYAIQVLKNEMVLKVDTCTQEMYLTDEDGDIQANKKNMYDWQDLLEDKWITICELKTACTELTNEFLTLTNKSIVDFNLIEYGRKVNAVDLSHLCARVIADNPFASCKSSGEDLWNSKYDEYLFGNIKTIYAPFFILADYVKNMKNLVNELVIYCKMYDFLYANGIVERFPYYGDKVVDVIQFIEVFLDESVGYYHPMCNVEIYNLKDELHSKLLTTEVGKEYYRYGVVKANVEDEYDAGWLSPEGIFYGGCGTRGSMIHFDIAQRMFECTASPIHSQMVDDGVTLFGSAFDFKTPESWLEHKGWMKIHDNEVYGYFSPDCDCYASDPTKEQIDFICKYINKHWNGKFYNEPQVLRQTTPIMVYDLKKMDKFAIRNLFEI